jgi:periodic tryptophan protein 2
MLYYKVSPQGPLMATGGLDGKVKLWHAGSGFCYATFADHAAPVEALCFSPQGNALLTASLDGSVRAYDLLR